jgi:hypothetical protein
MVFEGPFNHLMQKVAREQFVDVGAWKMGCERLDRFIQVSKGWRRLILAYHHIRADTKVVPQDPWIELGHQKFGLGLGSKTSAFAVKIIRWSIASSPRSVGKVR